MFYRHSSENAYLAENLPQESEGPATLTKMPQKYLLLSTATVKL